MTRRGGSVTPPKRTARKAAVALGYDPKQGQAPKVLAAGQGEVAEAILRTAREHGVPVHTDHPLAGALVRLEAGEFIPPELYAAVAEVLAFLWRTDQQAATKGGSQP
jgi:flagellar biosynthesis protein